MSFAGQGDIIEVDGEPEENWQYGRNLRSNKAGWFPANYLDRRPADSISAYSLHAPPPVDLAAAPRGARR